MKIIAFIGPDRVGKSSCAQQLAASLGWHVRAFGPPQPNWKSRFHPYKPLYPNEIWDRAYIDEAVYGVTRRLETEPCYREIVEHHTWLESLGYEIELRYIRLPWHVVKPRHFGEIYDAHPYATKYWQDMQMHMRFVEHFFYDKVINYLVANTKLRSAVRVYDNPQDCVDTTPT